MKSRLHKKRNKKFKILLEVISRCRSNEVFRVQCFKSLNNSKTEQDKMFFSHTV